MKSNTYLSCRKIVGLGVTVGVLRHQHWVVYVNSTTTCVLLPQHDD